MRICRDEFEPRYDTHTHTHHCSVFSAVLPPSNLGVPPPPRTRTNQNNDRNVPKYNPTSASTGAPKNVSMNLGGNYENTTPAGTSIPTLAADPSNWAPTAPQIGHPLLPPMVAAHHRQLVFYPPRPIRQAKQGRDPQGPAVAHLLLAVGLKPCPQPQKRPMPRDLKAPARGLC